MKNPWIARLPTSQVAALGELRSIPIQLLHGVVPLLGAAKPNPRTSNLLLHAHIERQIGRCLPHSHFIEYSARQTWTTDC